MEAGNSLEQRCAHLAQWYLVRTKPCSEAVAETNLRRQGYEIYTPLLEQFVRRAARTVRRIVPLFPGYVFLCLREGLQALSPVHSSVGVSSVVRFGSRYAVVPDRVVRDLQARADEVSGLHRLAEPVPLQPGRVVRIEAGPFDGLEGVFQRQAGPERVIVLLDLLGRGTAVRVASRFVLPASAA